MKGAIRMKYSYSEDVWAVEWKKIKSLINDTYRSVRRSRKKRVRPNRYRNVTTRNHDEEDDDYDEMMMKTENV